MSPQLLLKLEDSLRKLLGVALDPQLKPLASCRLSRHAGERLLIIPLQMETVGYQVLELTRCKSGQTVRSSLSPVRPSETRPSVVDGPELRNRLAVPCR